MEKIKIRFQCKKTIYTIGDETTDILSYLSSIECYRYSQKRKSRPKGMNMLGNYKESIIGNCKDSDIILV